MLGLQLAVGSHVVGRTPRPSPRALGPCRGALPCTFPFNQNGAVQKGGTWVFKTTKLTLEEKSQGLGLKLFFLCSELALWTHSIKIIEGMIIFCFRMWTLFIIGTVKYKSRNAFD